MDCNNLDIDIISTACITGDAAYAGPKGEKGEPGKDGEDFPPEYKNKVDNLEINVSALQSDLISEEQARQDADTELASDIQRVEGRIKTWGEVEATQEELLQMSAPDRNIYFNTWCYNKGADSIENGYAVYSASPDSHEWEYNDISTSWEDNGLFSVQQATNNELGIVKGSLDDNSVSVDLHGNMVVNPLDMDKIKGLIQELSDIGTMFTYKQDIIQKLTQAQYDDLPTEQKNVGIYDIIEG